MDFLEVTIYRNFVVDKFLKNILQVSLDHDPLFTVSNNYKTDHAIYHIYISMCCAYRAVTE